MSCDLHVITGELYMLYAVWFHDNIDIDARLCISIHDEVGAGVM